MLPKGTATIALALLALLIGHIQCGNVDLTGDSTLQFFDTSQNLQSTLSFTQSTDALLGTGKWFVRDRATGNVAQSTLYSYMQQLQRMIDCKSYLVHVDDAIPSGGGGSGTMTPVALQQVLYGKQWVGGLGMISGFATSYSNITIPFNGTFEISLGTYVCGGPTQQIMYTVNRGGVPVFQKWLNPGGTGGACMTHYAHHFFPATTGDVLTFSGIGASGGYSGTLNPAGTDGDGKVIIKCLRKL